MNHCATLIKSHNNFKLVAYEIAVPQSSKKLKNLRLINLLLFLYLVISLKLFKELHSRLRRGMAVWSKDCRKNTIDRDFLILVALDIINRERLRCRRHGSKKEVFQPHLPVRLPCYDLAPITSFALGRSLRSRTSGAPGFHGLTGGVYKARERIHRAMADARLLANPASWSRVADSSPN